MFRIHHVENTSNFQKQNIDIFKNCDVVCFFFSGLRFEANIRSVKLCYSDNNSQQFLMIHKLCFFMAIGSILN